MRESYKSKAKEFHTGEVGGILTPQAPANKYQQFLNVGQAVERPAEKQPLRQPCGADSKSRVASQNRNELFAHYA